MPLGSDSSIEGSLTIFPLLGSRHPIFGFPLKTSRAPTFQLLISVFRVLRRRIGESHRKTSAMSAYHERRAKRLGH
jgi:hypothetical protein